MTTPSTGIADELERLAALHKSGVLTDDEFKAQKAKVLNPQPVAAAPPPEKAKSGSGKIWLLLIVAGLIAYFYVDSEYPELFLSGLPKCDSREAKKMVERTVEDDSVGLARGRRIIQWLRDDSRTASTLAKVQCHARVALNVGGETGMAYTFEKKGDQILINVEFD